MNSISSAKRPQNNLLPQVAIDTLELAKSDRETNSYYIEQQFGYMYRDNPSLFESITRAINEMAPESRMERELLRDTAAETYHWLWLQSEKDGVSVRLPEASPQVCDGVEIARQTHADFVDDSIELMRQENPLVRVAANSYVGLHTDHYFNHAELVATIYRVLRNQSEIEVLNNIYNNSPDAC